MTIELKKQIESALKAFDVSNLRDCSISLLNILGYDSDKRIDIDSKPETFFDMLKSQSPKEFDADNFRKKTIFDQWKSASLLFQLTDDDISKQEGHSASNKVDCNFLKSYVFFAVSLSGKDYPRGTLANIARQINRVFPMPVMVLIAYDGKLTIAIINRRQDKRKHLDRDVLGKVTLIKDIDLQKTHPGHLDILKSISIIELSQQNKISGFDSLHKAWAEALNIELLNKNFYRRIQEWFFWSVQNVKFPHGGIDNDSQRNRIAVIRMLTRIIFCWFAREKGLIPAALFKEDTVKTVLNGFDPNSADDGSYYKAILQNLFFPTLAIPLDKREFRNGHRPCGVNEHYMNPRYFRHESMFKNPDDLRRLFEKIPFLNGGLFECLDFREEKNKKNAEVRVDGFSDVLEKQPLVPNVLFFGSEHEADLSKAYGLEKKSSVNVKGLFNILDSYKFTITENTPIEEEIALDPELLGRIFENLLAEYNPETENTARKETGSFYTPRTIVDYMVNESLKVYLEHSLREKLPEISSEDANTGLDILFSYTERKQPFTDKGKIVLLDAIYDCKIVDPACGSGAFPVGMLQKLVYVLNKLDYGHNHWKQRIIKDTPAPMKEETRKILDLGNADFLWKLGLIQNSIYGIDIQPIAAQIAKLRCFISLLVDFNVDKSKENDGVPPLPNLDFKFVAADTLVKAPGEYEQGDDMLGLEDPFCNQFAELAEEYFFVREPEHKIKMRHEIEKLIDGKIRQKEKSIADHLTQEQATSAVKLAIREKFGSYIHGTEHEIELWESYKNIFAFRNANVKFFDIKYFFPECKNGFDIVIGNPPYVQIQNFSGTQTQKDLEAQKYETFAKTGDIYCLFYERGYQLLRNNGVLSYISSNKWMRANYGKPMRKFFLEHGTLAQLIDFGDSPIFENATTYTNIAIWHKDTEKLLSKAWDLSKTYEVDISLEEMLKQKGECEALFNEDSFVLVKEEQALIKKRIEKAGIPLKNWDIQINFGIKTGFNEAFIVGGKKKDELIAKDPKCAKLIKPILRGRDIKKYKADFADLWLINTHNGIKDKDIQRINVQKDYPIIFKHLKQYEEPLVKREDQGEHWTNLRNCAYLDEIEKEKILYAEIVFDSAFYYDTQSYYPEATTFIITGERLKFLTALLNSNLLTYAFKTFYAGGDLRGNTFRYKKVFIENLPVPKIELIAQKPYEILVDCILFAKAKGLDQDASTLEWVVDTMVYGLYFEKEMKEDSCYINERIAEFIKPFKADDTDEFKAEYVRTFVDFCRKDDIIYHGLVHSRTVKPVKIINGAKDDRRKTETD